MRKLKFNQFLDDSWGIIRDSKRLINKFGWYKGDFFHKWVRDHVEKNSAMAMQLFVTSRKKKELEDSGRTGAENYFKWFNKKGSKPFNINQHLAPMHLSTDASLYGEPVSHNEK